MKTKLYTRMTIISVAVMLMTMLLTVGIFYNLFSEQVMADLRTHIHILRTTDNFVEYIEKDFDPQIDNLRITVIDTMGKVEYDSNADIGAMENHKDRPEIKAAREDGEGKAIRRSGTLDKNTYYYAEMLTDGRILRVAKEVGSIWQFCLRILPLLLAEILLSIVICMVAARFLAKSLVKPIELMAQNLDSDETMVAYEEIQPFLDKIHSQHKDLKKSTNIRQEFTANVSHELKTPLASISGYAELIETGMAKETDIRHFASEIHKSSNRLLALINDIIELSQLDVMDNEMDLQTINLAEQAATCVNMLKMNAEKHNISIMIDRIESDCLIHANHDMIDEIVYNLCDNAIRYNKPEGHVWVSVLKENDVVILQVKDDGIGIPKEDQERIFERFYRVDKARSKKTGGTGLGLAIVKHIAEQHKAEIILESEIDKGTKISLIFHT